MLTFPLFFLHGWCDMFPSLAWRVFLSIYFRADLLVIHSLSFPSPENSYLVLIPEGSFSAGHRILVWHFFSFSTLNILFHCLLVSMASDEESIVIQIIVPSDYFQDLSLSLIFRSLTMKWLGIFFCKEHISFYPKIKSILNFGVLKT